MKGCGLVSGIMTNWESREQDVWEEGVSRKGSWEQTVWGHMGTGDSHKQLCEMTFFWLNLGGRTPGALYSCHDRKPSTSLLGWTTAGSDMVQGRSRPQNEVSAF